MLQHIGFVFIVTMMVNPKGILLGPHISFLLDNYIAGHVSAYEKKIIKTIVIRKLRLKP